VHVIRAFGTLRLPHPDRSNKQTGPSFPKARFTSTTPTLPETASGLRLGR
jgi:hypothetical protein